MSLEYDFNRVYWHSRRGMLELDLVLMPFVEQHFEALNDEDKRCYLKLLECEDQDMFGWFLEHRVPEDDELKHIVGLVLAKHQQNT